MVFPRKRNKGGNSSDKMNDENEEISPHNTNEQDTHPRAEAERLKTDTHIVPANTHFWITILTVLVISVQLIHKIFIEDQHPLHKQFYKKLKFVDSIETIFEDPASWRIFLRSLKTQRDKHDTGSAENCQRSEDFSKPETQFPSEQNLEQRLAVLEEWKANLHTPSDIPSSSKPTNHDDDTIAEMTKLRKRIETLENWKEKIGMTTVTSPETEEDRYNQIKINLEGNWSVTTEIINVKLPTLQGYINSLVTADKSFKVRLSVTESKTVNMKSDIDDLRDKVKTLESDADIKFNEIRETLERDNTTLNNHTERLDFHKEQLDKINDKVIPDLENRLIDTIAHTERQNQVLDGHTRTFDEHEQWQATKKREDEDLKKKVDSVQENTSFKQSVSQDLLDEMRSKMAFHDIGLKIVGVMLIVVVIVIVISARARGGNMPLQTISRSPHQTGSRTPQPGYSLKWANPMENSVCVVTFHSETERTHLAETRSVFESSGSPVPMIHTRVVRGHSDIQDLPGSRIFLIFVDFNERNVILEDPEKGLGDLRVTTVRSLWRFGGDVTVIYCRDKGSKHLGNDLFNRNLSSVYSQTELSQLKNQGRMLSVFEGFTDYQKRHCSEFINRQLSQS